MKVLLTGSTGYIGRRLKRKLLEHEKISLRLFVRNKKKVSPEVLPNVEIVEGDTFNMSSLDRACANMDTAYYLIHSMGGKGNYEDMDRTSAENFLTACIKAGVKKIIYLGGLGNTETASKHLASRLETAAILSKYQERIQTIVFRAGVIIGSGGISYEMIRYLVERLPVMITPRWVQTNTEPIAVSDVLDYLVGAIEIPKKRGNRIIDLGSGKTSYGEMMMRTAKIFGLKRYMIPVPLLTPKLSSLWLILFVPVNFKIARELVQGLKSETVKENDNAKLLFPHIIPKSFEDSIREAVQEVENDQVISRWCDSSTPGVCDVPEVPEIAKSIYSDVQKVKINDLSPGQVFKALESIGGKRGWLSYNFLWQIRGFVDKLFGGAGINRGRRLDHKLRIGDSLDFWKVIDLVKDKRLLLEAQMKLPGKAWLEFVIENNLLIQTAYYYPKGIFGRLYWYSVLPAHFFVFKTMANNIIKLAENY